MANGRGRDDAFRDFAARDLRDFGRLLEAYTLRAMPPQDDPVFAT